MPIHRSRTTRALACVAMLALVSGCSASRARPKSPDGDDAPQPRTSTASDTRVGRDRSNQSYARIEELIEARAPGVRVVRNQDGSIRLQIRGVSSPTGHNDPLVVIDGNPTTELRPGSALAALNPSDVVSIEVLKDAASTAFYGMRGANGVIVITTRQQ
ncbi:MAG: TonB-dependent receptor plug domain-containing protein [Gemmatimonadaceae bacterium]